MNSSGNKDDGLSHIGSIEHVCEILHRIHESLPAQSEEREALTVAAKALLFAMPHEDFHAFLRNDELTREQKEHLAQLGVDFDDRT